MKINEKSQAEQQPFDDKVKEIEDMLKDIECKDYDVYKFITSLNSMVSDIHYFFNHLVKKQGGDKDNTYYKLSPRPKEGQVAYVNIGRGYPKELQDGHYCYILKDFGAKMAIIPTTSVKDGSQYNPDFEFDIKLNGFQNDLKTRMQITDMRVVDVQRINKKKGYYNVETDRVDIEAAVKKVLF